VLASTSSPHACSAQKSHCCHSSGQCCHSSSHCHSSGQCCHSSSHCCHCHSSQSCQCHCCQGFFQVCPITEKLGPKTLFGYVLVDPLWLIAGPLLLIMHCWIPILRIPKVLLQQEAQGSSSTKEPWPGLMNGLHWVGALPLCHLEQSCLCVCATPLKESSEACLKDSSKACCRPHSFSLSASLLLVCLHVCMSACLSEGFCKLFLSPKNNGSLFLHLKEHFFNFSLPFRSATHWSCTAPWSANLWDPRHGQASKPLLLQHQSFYRWSW
jgi:hypothetical protein